MRRGHRGKGRWELCRTKPNLGKLGYLEDWAWRDAPSRLPLRASRANRAKRTQFLVCGLRIEDRPAAGPSDRRGLNRAKQSQFRQNGMERQMTREKGVMTNCIRRRPRQNKAISRRRRVGWGLSRAVQTKPIGTRGSSFRSQVWTRRGIHAKRSQFPPAGRPSWWPIVLNEANPSRLAFPGGGGKKCGFAVVSGVRFGTPGAPIG